MNQLVSANETAPDLGFMARLMALCSLPRTNPGRRLQYKRVNGPYTLIMTAGINTKLPYGNLHRLLLAWVCTEAVRTQSRELVLGSSLGIDFYLWLTYRTFTLKRPLRLSWPRLYRQFGVDPVKAGERVTVDNFRKDCLRELKKIKVAWTDHLNYVTAPGALVLRPSKPAVPRVASSRRVALRSPSLAQNHPLAACEAIGGGGAGRLKIVFGAPEDKFHPPDHPSDPEEFSSLRASARNQPPTRCISILMPTAAA